MPRCVIDEKVYEVRRRWAGSAVGDAPHRWRRLSERLRRRLRPKDGDKPPAPHQPPPPPPESKKRPKHKKRRNDKFSWWDLIDVPDSLTLIAILIGLFLFVFYGVPVVVPLLGFLGEVLWLLILIPLVWLGRVLLRRPWTVEIIAPGGQTLAEWRVVGWLASGRAEAEIVRQLGMGMAPGAVMLDEAATVE